jgi:hypothetical protein
MRAERKVFFFEKKKQKTFAYCPQPPGYRGEFGAARNRQKFFGSFFKKVQLCCRFDFIVVQL